MSRPNAFITMTAGVALVFCLACLTGDRLGVSRAHAQPQGTPNPGGPAATPIPFDEGDGQGPTPTPCPPPASFPVTNNTSNQIVIMYTCKGSGLTVDTIDPDKTIIFDVDGHCSDCADDCTCIKCELTELFVNGQRVSLCDPQQAYMAAYGLDLFAEPLILTESSAPQYDQYGRQVPRWAIPVLNDERELVEWEFTRIEPEFSVEDGEVVIRARRDQVMIKDDQVISIVRIKKGEIIGGPQGVTVDDAVDE